MSRVDVARVAERQGTLLWSRVKLTATHIGNARKYYDEAQTLSGEAREAKMAQALYCVDMALHMNPSMVDALILKSQITDEASYIKYEESILKDSYDAVLDEELKELGAYDLPIEEAEAQEAAEAGEAIEPKPLDQEKAGAAPQFNVFGEAPADTTQNQAQADDAWLEKMLAEQFGQENTAPQATEPEQAKVFGFSWGTLTTAQLLQLSEQAQTETQSEDATADVPTETD